MLFSVQSCSLLLMSFCNVPVDLLLQPVATLGIALRILHAWWPQYLSYSAFLIVTWDIRIIFQAWIERKKKQTFC